MFILIFAYIFTEFIASNIFHKSYNIFNFIKDTVSVRGWQSCTSYALVFLRTVFTKHVTYLKNYYALTAKECLDIARSKVTAYDKEKAIAILCIVLKEQNENISHEVHDIYTSYLNFLRTYDKNTSSVVLRSVFVLLGTIARYYRDQVVNEEQLIAFFVNILSGKNPGDSGTANVFVGGFEGLADILYNFSFVVKESQSRSLYNLVKKASDKKWLTDKHRNDDCRAALHFITEHPYILTQHIALNEFDWWHDTLRSWNNSENSEKRKAGLYALIMFYKEISDIFSTDERGLYTVVFKVIAITFLNNTQNYFGISLHKECLFYEIQHRDFVNYNRYKVV